MNEALSTDDMTKYLGKLCKVIKYSQLIDVHNIDEFMKDVQFLVLLYETEPRFGHWTCLIRNDILDIFEFFDSYGTKPDLQLLDIPIRIRNALGQEYPLLATLLFKSRRKIHYNNHKLQKLDKNIATCGKWVIFRCLMCYLNVDLFVNMIENYNKKDKELDKTIQKMWLELKKTQK